jgi:phosphoribosylglycinamide formyltransferase-1
MTLRLAVLGSTRGTDLQFIIDAIKSDELDAKIEVVVSNRKKAFILERARIEGLRSLYVPQKGKTREEFDTEVLEVLDQFKIDLILLIGYMRILSPVFIEKWRGKILNVHPSLLPEFAGGMDSDVHSEVLKAGVGETGCTIHQVDETVDGGEIVLQKKCSVLPEDTADTLKQKVQKLEGEAFVEVLKGWK